MKRFARAAMDVDRRLTFEGFSLDLATSWPTRPQQLRVRDELRVSDGVPEVIILPPAWLCATKDTYMSIAMTAGVNTACLEAQTGVRYETLKRH